MTAITADVELEGRLWTQSQPILSYHLDLMTKDLAEQAATAVKFQGQTSFRYESSPPTGNWMRSIRTRQSREAASGRFTSGYMVHDSGLVYGPWLEGVGSRNAPVTRFKGYSMFRKVAQQLERKAPDMVKPQTRRMAKELER